MAVEGRTVSHYYILVIREFVDFMSLFRHSVWFSFSVKQFPSAEFGICNLHPGGGLPFETDGDARRLA